VVMCPNAAIGINHGAHISSQSVSYLKVQLVALAAGAAAVLVSCCAFTQAL
jgi:hypothetical protein